MHKLSKNFKTALEIVIRDNFEKFTIIDIIEIFNSHPGLNIEKTLNEIKLKIKKKEAKEEILKYIRGLFNIIKFSSELKNILEKEDYLFLTEFANFCLKYINENENNLKL